MLRPSGGNMISLFQDPILPRTQLRLLWGLLCLTRNWGHLVCPLSHPHDTGESVLSFLQMMLSNSPLLLGPNNVSESHPCGPLGGEPCAG